ncbi:MAG: glycine zipper 2TM domain-containing protein [Gammaproteobacteria bacterium]|nr:glycine zipper 2TM domain-containing protein [Gammaproteobacteria bacterium]
MKTIRNIFFVGIALLSLTACAPNLSPNVYSGGDVGQAARTVPARVVSMRKVKINNQSAVGGLAGAGAGAVAGSAIGGGNRMHALGAIGGAVVGGLVGSEVDKMMHSGYGYEYVLRTNKGNLVSVTQTQDLQLRKGQRVYIIYGRRTRIVPR